MSGYIPPSRDNTALSLRSDGTLVVFDPTQTREKVARLDGDIVTARQLRDWPKLAEAVDEKIAEQTQFVASWRTMVRGQQPEIPTRGFLSVAEAEAAYGIADSTVSRWRNWVSPEHVAEYRERIILGAHRKALLEPEPNRQAPNSGEEEWFTPAQYIEAARMVMGGIDLDPASCAEAQVVVQAAQWFSRADDGLSLSWHGRVWLNPPYSYPAVERFTEKLCIELATGAVEQAVMVVNNCTDTGWFHATQSNAALLCFTRGRIRFYGPGSGDAPLQGQAFFYFGERVDEFREVFGAFGFIR